MRANRWLFLMLFLASTLLTVFLSPLITIGEIHAASAPAEVALLGGMNGRTLLRSGEALDVSVGNTSGAHQIQWFFDGRMVGRTPDLHLRYLPDGEHFLSLTYRDAQNRLYMAASPVRIMDAASFAALTVAVQTVISIPLLDEDDQIFIPMIVR